MSYYKAYAVAIASLLTGAAVVHNIYKPDLVCTLLSLTSTCYAAGVAAQSMSRSYVSAARD